jgi:hypothetical protein
MVNKHEESDPRFSAVRLRRELVASGYSDKAIARLVAEGVLARPRYGAYVDGAVWRACDEVQRHGLVARSVLRRAGAGLALSHITAAGEWNVEMWDLRLDDVHTVRTDAKPGRRREAGVVQHVGALRPGDVVTMNGVDVASAARTAADCMTEYGVERGLTIVNSLLRRGHLELADLEECCAFMDRWPGTLNHRVVLGLATSLTESIGEDRSVFLFWWQGLPRPVLQYEVRDDHGRVIARVDFAWPELGVFVEFDGKVKYSSIASDKDAVDVVLREKRREERICELTGWRCIRITWADLYHPERTADRIRSAFRVPASR